MANRQKNRTKYICTAGLVAALYVALTFISMLMGLDSGVIQIRISEALCVLPIFIPSAIPGLFVGCFLSNLLAGANLLDIVIGPIATLIGALGTYLLRRYKWLAPLPAVLANTLIIPFVLSYAYGTEQAIPLIMLTVGIGEVISVYGVGGIFLISARRFLEKLK